MRDVFSAGEPDHLVTDINADSPGEPGNHLGQYEPGTTTHINYPAGSAKLTSFLDGGANLVQEPRVGIVFIQVAVRLLNGSVPGVRSLIPTGSYLVQQTLVIKLCAAWFFRESVAGLRT